jgi:signal transduction histidine kinase
MSRPSVHGAAMTARKPNWLAHGGNVAFAVTVAVALVPLFFRPAFALTTPRGAGLAAVGLGYVLLAFFGPLEKPGPARGRMVVAYFAVQTVLLAAIFLLSRFGGMAALCVLPLVGQTVGCAPRLAGGVFIAALFALVLGASAWVSGGASGLIVDGGGLLAAFAFVIVFTRVAVSEKRTREHAEQLAADLATANQQLRDAAARTEELAMARERNRLAREIHDSLGHYLTTVAVQLEAARALHAADPARSLAAVEKAHGLAREALVEVRRSVGALRAEGPAQPLVARLHELVASLPVAALSVLGEPRRLGPEVEHGLFRAAQEGLTNVRKHASARHVAVTVDFSAADRVRLSVVDDGCGCAQPTGGFGLTGLRERLALLGGSVEAANRAEGGFALRVELSG